jgi:Protein of unknown function (DUF3298)/Deacetylase PdaC
MFRSTLLASAALLSVSACQPKAAAPVIESDPVVAAPEAAPEDPAFPPSPEEAEVDVPLLPVFAPETAGGPFRLSFNDATSAYEITGEVDPAIAEFDPALAQRLAGNLAQNASNFAATAKADELSANAETKPGEENWFRGYGYDSTLKVTAQAGDLISIEEMVSTYTGGAHGLYGYGGLVVARGNATPKTLADFVTDKPGFESAVKEFLIEEKIKRGYSPDARAQLIGEVDDALSSGDTWSDNFSLAASDKPGKFGGITVYFSPYHVGSYAEGSFEITVPYDRLKPMLTPAMAPRFAGVPVLPASD